MNPFTDIRYLVLTGNYGSGKTEIALNAALEACDERKTTLVDLDIVNPYFRSGEKADILRKKGIEVLMPTFALTTVDIPALPAEIQSVFESAAEKVIFDVGGDDTGAAALGRYYPSFLQHKEETAMAFVVNCMRPLTQNMDDITDLVKRIEKRGRLRTDFLINNTNLGDQTAPEMVEKGEAIVLNCAEKLGIRFVMTAGMESVLEKCRLKSPVLPVKRYMIPEWMMEQP